MNEAIEHEQALDLERQDPLKKVKSEIISWAKTIIIAFITVFLVQRFVFISVRVQGMSMYPTLYDGERLILWSLGYQPDSFDIIVLQHESGEDYVKRIIGIPGDDISYRQGSLFINGEPVSEAYVYEGESFSEFDLSDICQFENCDRIPEGYYLVMGDNRNHSEDSRHFGLIREDSIRGVVTWRYWPLADFGRVRN